MAPAVDQDKLNECMLKHRAFIKDMGKYEHVGRTMQARLDGLAHFLPLMMDALDFCPCCEIGYGQWKLALAAAHDEAKKLQPSEELNIGQFNLKIWSMQKTERFMTVFNHFRKIKRMKAKEWSALIKKSSKDSVQKCREVMRRIDTTSFGLEESDGEVSLDGHGLPSMLRSPPAAKRVLAVRVSDESALSLDSAGLPKMLGKGKESYPKETSILEKLQLVKRPDACDSSAKNVMKKPSAKAAVGKVLVKIIRKNALKMRPKGCSKCREKAGCTPSCWRLRGFLMV